MEEQTYYAIIRLGVINQHTPTTVFPGDIFNFNFDVYHHSIHPYDTLTPRLIYQSPSESITCKRFFQEYQNFLGRVLSSENFFAEPLEELIDNILSPVRENFQLVDPPLLESPRTMEISLHIELINTLFDNDYLHAVLEESMQNFRMVPASNEAIQASLKKSMVMTPGECCSVCLEDLNVNGECYAMPCNHVFHQQCIMTWLQTGHVCPLCRYALPIL